MPATIISSITGLPVLESSSLTIEQCPTEDSSWEDKMTFALTFDGYEFHDSFETCAQIANKRMHGSLDELRTCLFFEQRRARINEQSRIVPSQREDAYIRELIRLIRLEVSKSKN